MVASKIKKKKNNFIKSIRIPKYKENKKDLPTINSCLNLIKNLKKNENNEKMKLCYLNILKISKLFPPAKNENKFIYGKLIEMELINSFNNFTICEDLDKNHKVGSEYKNDCIIKKKKFSIKASKNGGEVTIINKLNKVSHIIDINFIICHISKRKLFIFPNLIINKDYIIDKQSNIHFKSSIFKYIEDNHKKFVYNFPEIEESKLNKINKLNEINIYQYLYNKFIIN